VIPIDPDEANLVAAPMRSFDENDPHANVDENGDPILRSLPPLTTTEKKLTEGSRPIPYKRGHGIDSGTSKAFFLTSDSSQDRSTWVMMTIDASGKVRIDSTRLDSTTRDWLWFSYKQGDAVVSLSVDPTGQRAPDRCSGLVGGGTPTVLRPVQTIADQSQPEPYGCWSGGWTRIVPFESLSGARLFLAQKDDGTVSILAIRHTSTDYWTSSVVYASQWGTDWDTFLPFHASDGNVRVLYLLSYASTTGRVALDTIEIKADGKSEVKGVWEGKWSTGWKHFARTIPEQQGLGYIAWNENDNRIVMDRFDQPNREIVGERQTTWTGDRPPIVAFPYSGANVVYLGDRQGLTAFTFSS
jgi:hypothetical protein